VRTDEFLQSHDLTSLTDTISLIMQHISAIDWRMEINSIEGIPDHLVEELLSVMDQDRRA
jgi:uncharacterized protein YecA (UPF0149 family)